MQESLFSVNQEDPDDAYKEASHKSDWEDDRTLLITNDIDSKLKVIDLLRKCLKLSISESNTTVKL